MKTTTIFGVVAIVALAMAMPNVMMAAPAQCSTFTNYAQLLGTNSGALADQGCLIDGLLFRNFTFAGSATGSGGPQPIASQMTFNVLNGVVDSHFGDNTGDLLYGFDFNPNISVLGIGSLDVAITYDVVAAFPTITSAHIGMTGRGNATNGSGGVASVIEGDTGCTGAQAQGGTIIGTGCGAELTPRLTITDPNTGIQKINYEGIGPYLLQRYEGHQRIQQFDRWFREHHLGSRCIR
jgi:hypothetical protein